MPLTSSAAGVVEDKDGPTSEQPLLADNTRRNHCAIVADVLQQVVLADRS